MGEGGIERIIEARLDPREREQLAQSAAVLRGIFEKVTL